jgi:2-keto-4-pentenoate hydratase
MPIAHELRSIAHQIKAAQDEARHIEPLTARLHDFDVPTAYAVAQLIHEARLAEGAVAVGRKIGFTNPDLWSRYGVREPVWGYMYDTTVVRLSAQQCTRSLRRFVDPKIEPEIVFHFRCAPPAGADLAAILDCIDWVAHAFEIVQSHFPEWKFQAADTVADSALHAALLLGEPQAVSRLGTDPVAALASFSLALSCDGEVREVGRGSNVLGHPLAAIAHLVGVLAKQPQSMPLQANEMVTTGTVTAALPVRAGETWKTTIEGIALPGLSVEFVA